MHKGNGRHPGAPSLSGSPNGPVPKPAQGGLRGPAGRLPEGCRADPRLGISKVVGFNLDGYSTMEPGNIRSHHYVMHRPLFDHVDIPWGKVILPGVCGNTAGDRTKGTAMRYQALASHAAMEALVRDKF